MMFCTQYFFKQNVICKYGQNIRYYGVNIQITYVFKDVSQIQVHA